MDVKRHFSIAAAALALGVAGPAVASAADGGNGGAAGTNDPTVTTPVTTGATTPGDQQGTADSSTADEQQTGEQGDVQNTDLATQVEQVDGAAGNGGINEEGQVENATTTDGQGVGSTGATGSTGSTGSTGTSADNSTVTEQQTGEQGDVQNTDLATQVEQVDGAAGNGDVNQESQAGDSSANTND